MERREKDLYLIPSLLFTTHSRTEKAILSSKIT